MTNEQKLEQIAAEIRRVSQSIRDLRDGPLSDRCICVLVKDVTGIPMTKIRQVLDGLEALEEIYLKPTEEAT